MYMSMYIETASDTLCGRGGVLYTISTPITIAWGEHAALVAVHAMAWYTPTRENSRVPLHMVIDIDSGRTASRFVCRGSNKKIGVENLPPINPFKSHFPLGGSCHL